jgi:hypothetical protein
MESNKRRRKYMGTPFQNKLLFLVFASAVIPAAIVTLCLYYLIFNTLAWQMVIPESIAYNLIPVLQKVNLILAIAVPISLLIIWFIALELSHRVAGPLYRLEKELDERINKTKHGEIRLREKDEFKSLAGKINKLIVK